MADTASSGRAPIPSSAAILDRLDIAYHLLKLERPSARLAMAMRLIELAELDVAALGDPIERDPLAITEPATTPLDRLLERLRHG